MLLVIFSVITFTTNKKRSCEFPMAQQVQVFTTCYCPPPQYEYLRRIGISKQLKCATIPSLSVSASSVLRNASFCCTSSVHCNLPSSPKIFVKGNVSPSIALQFCPFNTLLFFNFSRFRLLRS